MKVKRLEIQGFKSFKDKTIIHFDDGVTGIIGPNGCGKSNIVDSFFWVMGEQSAKHLRGTTSGDLIFSGSEKYAASQLAEVTMVLSTGAPKESELPEGTSIRDLPTHLRYPEVSITRRLYRDGQSEYLINGMTCRLKDIHELFMDTGAGPKAYSIIEQGQISKIVASKPEDRRVLIEEAAGITKFKARKKESMRKIEATQQNLARVNDILSEIERQLSSLEKQAAKARQYKAYKEELKETELLVGKKRLFDLKTKVRHLSDEIVTLSETDQTHKNDLSSTELEVERLKLETMELQTEADDVLQRLQQSQRELSSQQTKVELHKRRIEELHNSSVTLEEEASMLDQKLSHLDEEKRQLDDEVASTQSSLQSKEETLRERQDHVDSLKEKVTELQRSVEDSKKSLLARMGQQNELSNQTHSLEARVDALSVRLSQLQDRISQREMDCADHGARKDTLSLQVEELTQAVTALSQDVDALKQSIADDETRLKTLRGEEAAARQERASVESRAKALQQLLESHEGVRTDVKDLMKDSLHGAALAGLFADALEAHPGFEYALEASLKDYFEDLFVQDRSTAAQLISELKKAHKGRARFWCLDLLQTTGVERRLPISAADVVSQLKSKGLDAWPLEEVVRFNHTASQDVLASLQNLIVVATLEQGIEAFLMFGASGFTFVSREGDLIDPQGRVTGGGMKSLQSGLLARKSELQKLQESLIDISKRHEELHAELIEREERLGRNRELFSAKQADLQRQEVDWKVAQRDLGTVTQALEQATRELDGLKAELAELTEERQGHWVKLDEIRNELGRLEESFREAQSSIDVQSEELSYAQSKLGESQALTLQLKVELASAQERRRYLEERRVSWEREAQASRGRREEIRSLSNRKLDEKDLVQQELLVFEEAIEALVLKNQQGEDELGEKKNRLEEARASLNEAFDRQRKLLKSGESTTHRLGQARVEQEKSLIEFQGLIQGLFERYGLEEGQVEYEPAFDDITPEREKEMFAEVERLRDKIRRLGEVNVMADEEYDSQRKRFDFLSQQRDDLLRSIADLEKAIERINRTSQDRFGRAYEEINKRFQQIFPLVFGGGWAKLEMTNPEDLMETGIEIIAEPPGKKVGSIQLMSGGEKALTAVALIFSIFLIKPSPFCVLDEVDAPLDDHNVGKFNMLLKEMAIRSQFIIITHNKRTMELNQKLYGVTMEEPGVSKMVSIQLQG